MKNIYQHKYLKYKNKYFKLLQQIGGKLCSFCKKEISDANFTIHELRCPKVNFICEVCAEPFLKVNRDKHMKQHEQVECSDCGEIITRMDLTDHSLDCLEREVECPECNETYRAIEMHYCLIECPFCEINKVRANQIEDHIKNCQAANRTVKCHRCHKWIRNKNLEDHLQDHQSGQIDDLPAPRENDVDEIDCPECDEVFNDPSLRAVHRMTVHGHDETHFSCPKCQGVFELEDDMYTHLGYQHSEDEE